jgi:hypothetical protein
MDYTSRAVMIIRTCYIPSFLRLSFLAFAYQPSALNISDVPLELYGTIPFYVCEDFLEILLKFDYTEDRRASYKFSGCTTSLKSLKES